MAVSVYWDSNFKARSLTPAFVDALGVPSPIVISTSVELEVPTSALVLQLRCLLNLNFQLEISLDGSTYETGSFSSQLTGAIPMELPLQGVKKVRITGSGTVEFNFLSA